MSRQTSRDQRERLQKKARQQNNLTRGPSTRLSRRTAFFLSALICATLFSRPARAQAHRAEQDREIRYWLLDPSTHAFRISHDFTVDRVGQASVHSFVRKGSEVSPDSKITLLDTGEVLHTHIVTGKDVNALGYYREHYDDDTVVVQGDLPHALEKGQTVRVRVEESYVDPVGYKMDGQNLVWTRTLGRPVNFVTLPDGWMLAGVNTPATITLDPQGRVTLRFTNTHPGDLAVTLRARKRYIVSPVLRPATGLSGRTNCDN
jgi:hypothetical protein